MFMGGAASPDQGSVVAAILEKGRQLVRDEVVTIPDFGRGWRTDTTKVQGLPVCIKSVAHHRYLSSSPDGDVKHHKEAKEWEQFTLLHLRNGLVSFRTAHGRYLGAPDPDPKSSKHLTTKNFLREWEMFTLEHIFDERYALRTYHGKYVGLILPKGFCEKVVLANQALAGEWEQFEIEVNSLDKKGPVGEAGGDTEML
ncbi:hypothetical protein KFL_001340210 [Klebsormidium nitens]|uniref:Uncharacterized protein n=1 Tax=Klebsormidium nitens TaxID=105231 RepID=A0A1Y1I2U8_KLENI|nr:hypothetical protein KFL_001340210 [Klebsormidium nitens]|eukprot:GAQ83066.1 hypothetical protein KFL_001340210 [Klebsormidium nitens]